MSDDLCKRGLHPRTGDGPCEKCRPGKGETLCGAGLHDLSLPDATYTEKDGKTRCAECRKARRKKARLKRRRAEAEAERGVVEEAPPVEDTPTIAVSPPAGIHRPGDVGGYSAVARQGLYRHALLIRRQRGLLP